MARAGRFWAASAGCALLLVALYLAARFLHLPVLGDPVAVMHGAGSFAALAAVTLLVLDVLLPVPSSLVMVAGGALFGLAGGALVALTGRAGAFIFGYWLGAKALPLAKRFVPEEELAHARALLERHGALAIVVSRPVPIIAETVAVMSGLAGLPLGRCFLAALAGSLPEAVVLAAAGHYASNLNAPLYISVGLITVLAIGWVVSRPKVRRSWRSPG